MHGVRFSLRALRRRPGYVGATLATIVVGLGLNAVMWALADAIVFRPLPYPEPSQLVTVEPPADLTEDEGRAGNPLRSIFAETARYRSGSAPPASLRSSGAGTLRRTILNPCEDPMALKKVGQATGELVRPHGANTSTPPSA